MNLDQVRKTVLDKNKFTTLQNYIDFALHYLEYIEENKQATIVSQNEPKYNFFQYGQEAEYKITRPFNSQLLYDFRSFDTKFNGFINVLNYLKHDKQNAEIEDRNLINRTIYTLQQCIGFGLDSVSGNTAKKLNGDLFERLMLLVFRSVGISCKNGVVSVPIIVDGKELFKMQYQHDLIVENELDRNIRLFGSVKTTSKDRIDKIFMDKFLYSKLTETEIPYIAIFLHDVQRKNTKNENKYGISTTFLPGHFKGYTVKLNPLDGVYYFDPRPIMSSDELLKKHIKTFDNLICNDIWEFTK